MSTNARNIRRPDYFKNYTKKIKRREILVESGKVLQSKVQQVITSVNSEVNQIIQSINLKVADRQIPYITLEILFKPEIGPKARMVLIEQDTQSDFEKKIERSTAKIGHDVSHFIELLASDSYNEVVISPIGCDSEIVVSREYLSCAIVDILLDIAMFNSYSFLKEKSVSEKHDFCTLKYNYYKRRNLDCFYEYKSDKELYYAFSFTARKDPKSLDVDEYISLWEDFVSSEFPGCVHVEKTVLQQLKQHVDYENLPRRLSGRFMKMPKGAYLLLRTNKDATEALHPSILSAFGIKKYRIGATKIIPIEQFNSYAYLFVNLDVSVFKVVVR